MHIPGILRDKLSHSANRMNWLDRKAGAICLAVILCVALPLPAGAGTKGEFVGCWRNKVDDHAAGRVFNLCFGSDELTIFIWMPSGGSDYVVYNWTLINNYTIHIGNTRCKYQNQSGHLLIENCQFLGEYWKR